ncbi:MAG: glycosyltransferase [Actinomycetota bacterium]|nr:glycosyltransferase [Actinomycetota bacterium]
MRWGPVLAAGGSQVIVDEVGVNRGKRDVLADTFTEHDPDVFVTVDSDTILAPDAIAEIVVPFADPTVMAATGVVLAANWRRNLLTRLIDVRYANAFLFERAAYSRLGSVLCCCGSLSAYRAEVVRAHVDDFVNQMFLGARQSFGDDRRLTNYALQHGRVVSQETARASTYVPERLSHYVRQQVRWNKSFFRESLWAVTRLPARSPAMWLSLLELVTWVVFTGVLCIALVVRPLEAGAAVLGSWMLFAALMSWARSVRYFDARPAEPLKIRLAVFALAPLYGLLHVVLLLPLRLWSLATLRDNGWGTRTDGAEVAATGL